MGLNLTDDMGIMSKNTPNAVVVSAPKPGLGLQDDLGILKDGGSKTTGKPFYDALGATMSPEMKAAHPVLSGIEQTAQDVGTVAEKAANGITLGGLDYGLRKGSIEPPNFDNTAPDNKSGLNLMGDVASLGAGNKTLGVIGGKVIAPAAKAVAKAVPEGLKQSSYALMQSIVNQLPKEFKYGANAGRAMVREKFSGDAADIKEQAENKLDEIKGEGDRLASSVNKPVNNSNAIKIIDDKIAELQAKSPRTSASTIKKLQDSKNDLLGVKEGVDGNGNKIILDQGKDVSNMSAKDTLDLKRAFDDHTAWKGTSTDDTVYNKTMQQARTQLKDNLNDAAPGMKEWNQRYADLRAAQQAATRKVGYDQAGAGLSNIINNAVRGTIGITTLGAALTGHGAAAGEILAGWGAKEVLGNPMVKSKLAQALYGLSEADKMAIFKAAPWMRKAVSDTMENFRQKPTPRGEPVDAELVDNRPLGIGQARPIVRPDRMLPSDASRGTGPTITPEVSPEYKTKTGLPFYTTDEEGRIKGTGFLMGEKRPTDLDVNDKLTMAEKPIGDMTHEEQLSHQDKIASIKMDAEMAKSELKMLQSWRKDLSGKISMQEFNKGESQDLGKHVKWAISKSGGSALDDKASEFFSEHPEAYPKGFKGHDSDALLEVIKDLSQNRDIKYQGYLRNAIASARKVK